MRFHDELNQKLFSGMDLRPEVADKLNEIADAFIEYMEINPEAVKDIVITGSSASYNYTQYSDLDLHLKVDYDMIHEDCPIVAGFLWALKSSFNSNHDISIYGVPVEVYAEPLDEDTVHNGLYSLRQGKWIDIPEKIEPTDNDDAVNAKFNEFKDAADRVEDSEVAEQLINKLYQMRKAGLEEVGEFSTENLAFKKVRDAGILDKLKQMKKEQIDKELSLEEDVNSFCDTLDAVNDELQALIKSLSPVPAMVESLNTLCESAETIFNLDLIRQALRRETIHVNASKEAGVEPKIMLFIIQNDRIIDTKCIERDEVYTYTPGEDEYYLDRVRDSEVWYQDYNLEPAQKLVDKWNGR